MAGRAAAALRGTLHTRPCVWAVRHVLPRLHLPTRGLPEDAIAEGREHLRLADVLLALSPLGVPAMLTKGFDHAALVVGDDAIAEMCGKGFCIVTWTEFCRHYRRVCIVRCTAFRRYESDDEYPVKVALECMAWGAEQRARRKLVPVQYDEAFAWGNDKLTCVELAAVSDFENRWGLTPLRLNWLDQAYMIPQQFLDSKCKSVPWDSAGKLSGYTKA